MWAFIAILIGIYLAVIGLALGITKTFDLNRSGALLLIGISIALLTAVLEAPWYIDPAFGLLGNIFKFTGAFFAAAIPVMVSLVTHSTAKRHAIIFSILVGTIAIPLGLVAFMLISCLGGDCL